MQFSFKLISIIPFFLIFLVTSLYSQESVYSPSYANLGRKISKTQDPKNPEQLISSNRFFGVEVACSSIFSSTSGKELFLTKVGTGDRVSTVSASENFHVRKNRGWQDMIFKYASIPDLYDVVRSRKTPSTQISAFLSESIAYFPSTTKYPLSPLAYQKGLHKKEYSELSWEEKKILDGSINPQVNVRDFSDLGYFPTLTISGFFYKFIAHTSKDSRPSDFDIPFETFCKKYNIPFVRGRAYGGDVHVRGKAKLHVVPTDVVELYDNYDWKYLGSVEGLYEEGFELDTSYFNEQELALLNNYNEDFSTSHVYIEFLTRPHSYPATYAEYMVPVDASNNKKLFRELGIKLEFRYNDVDKKVLERLKIPKTLPSTDDEDEDEDDIFGFDGSRRSDLVEDYGDDKEEEDAVEEEKDYSYEFYKAHGFDYSDYDFIN